MGHRDDGAAMCQPIQRLLHRLLGFRIECRGGFIEQQDRRIAQEGPRDGESLALAAGKLQPALADQRIIALRQPADEAIGFRRFRRGPHFRIGRVRTAIADIFHHRALEQLHILRDHGDRRNQAGLGQFADRLAVDQHLSFLNVEQALQQREHG